MTKEEFRKNVVDLATAINESKEYELDRVIFDKVSGDLELITTDTGLWKYIHISEDRASITFKSYNDEWEGHTLCLYLIGGFLQLTFDNMGRVWKTISDYRKQKSEDYFARLLDTIKQDKELDFVDLLESIVG